LHIADCGFGGNPPRQQVPPESLTPRHVVPSPLENYTDNGLDNQSKTVIFQEQVERTWR
jgi:hypothetical protein